MDDINKMILNNPMFIQALKDFETMGFIKIKENGVEIIDRSNIHTIEDIRNLERTWNPKNTDF